MLNSEIIIWKNFIQEQHIYMIQVSSGSFQEIKKIKELLKDWKPVGEGFNNKDGKEIFLFSKIFQNSFAWDKWFNEAPKRLGQMTMSSQGQTSELKLEPNKTFSEPTSKGLRKCGLCGKLGHYRSTCKAQRNEK